MPIFRYQAFDLKGKRVSGDITAAGLADSKELLKTQGLIPFKIYEAQADSSFLNRLLSLLEGGVPDKIKIQFTNQLSILLKASVPLVDAMTLIRPQFEGKFGKVVGKIIEQVKEGISLADSMEKYPKIFTDVYIQLIRAGEASAKLELVLDRMTEFLERSEEVSGAIFKALRFPILMAVSILLVFVGAVTFVIPEIAGTLSVSGKTLPWITQAMLDLAYIFKNYFLIVVALLLVVIISVWSYISTEKGKVKYHSFLLKVPKVSSMTKNQAVAQFAQTLGMLMQAGVNLPIALDIVSNIVENAVLRQALKKAREEIIKEGKIAKHLRNTNIFPPVANYMIKTGEESANLGEMLIKVGKDSERDLMESIDSLVSAINPVLMVLITVVVGVIAAAIFMPIMQIADFGV